MVIKRVLLTALLISYIGYLLSMFNILKLMVEKIPVEANIIAVPLFLIFITTISLILANIGKMIWNDR